MNGVFVNNHSFLIFIHLFVRGDSTLNDKSEQENEIYEHEHDSKKNYSKQ